MSATVPVTVSSMFPYISCTTNPWAALWSPPVSKVAGVDGMWQSYVVLLIRNRSQSLKGKKRKVTTKRNVTRPSLTLNHANASAISPQVVTDFPRHSLSTPPSLFFFFFIVRFPGSFYLFSRCPFSRLVFKPPPFISTFDSCLPVPPPLHPRAHSASVILFFFSGVNFVSIEFSEQF